VLTGKLGLIATCSSFDPFAQPRIIRAFTRSCPSGRKVRKIAKTGVSSDHFSKRDEDRVTRPGLAEKLPAMVMQVVRHQKNGLAVLDNLANRDNGAVGRLIKWPIVLHEL
jgi:hypothetical protein